MVQSMFEGGALLSNSGKIICMVHEFSLMSMILLTLHATLHSSGYRLNDGYWHTVDLAARDNLLTLTIDEEEGSPLKITNPFTIRTGDRYFFGGEVMTSNS